MNSGIADCGPLKGLSFIREAPNAVAISGAVSPIARATPRITDVIRPLRAVGRTTPHVVRHSVAPIASDASRRPSGTSRSTSSEVRVMIGSIEIEIASDAAKPENPNSLTQTA
jgi:hypothetical protein